MKDKKILLVIQNLGGGGAEKVFINLANGFAEEGYKVSLLLGKKEGVYFQLVNEKVKLEVLNAKSLLDYYKKLPDFIGDKRFTHVFTASDYITAAMYLTKKKMGYDFQLIATLHYDLPFQLSILPRPNRIWLKWLNKLFISKADKIVSVSDGVGKGFRQVVGRPLKQLQTIYNPVFSEKIYSLAAEELTNPLLGSMNVVSIGRLVEQKDPLLLLKSFRLLHNRMPQVHLYMLGEGPLLSVLEEYVFNNKLNDFVHFMGFQTNPYKFLSKSNLLVLSSIYEGLGNVIIEALALGINVVSTDCPSGPSEILDNGKYGWLSPVKDVSQLSDKMEEALLRSKDSSLLQKRAEMFLERVIIKKYIEFLNS